jgi:hypothetical protein
MRYGRQIDANQSKIDAMARMVGAHVIDTTGDGRIGFDRLYVLQGKTYIVEIKDGDKIPSKQALSNGEQKRKEEVEKRGVKYHVIKDTTQLLQMFGVKFSNIEKDKSDG